jgi:hypothetical protein
MLCDVGYIPDKRVSWNERPELTGQVEELIALILWNRLDRPAMARNFISRRVQPCQRTVHAEYEDLDHNKVVRRIEELFNLTDQSYSPPNRIQHAYKLILLAPRSVAN